MAIELCIRQLDQAIKESCEQLLGYSTPD